MTATAPEPSGNNAAATTPTAGARPVPQLRGGVGRQLGDDPARPALPRRPPPPKGPRHPALALSLTLLLGLLAAFFGWQSADPVWLAFGRGDVGTATVTWCDASDGLIAGAGDDNPRYPCTVFVADSGAFAAVDITVLGAGGQTEEIGSFLRARMLSGEHTVAYAGSRNELHLRWGVGMVLVLACGAGIVFATGATRLNPGRHRRVAVALSFAGPVLLAGGFVLAAG